MFSCVTSDVAEEVGIEEQEIIEQSEQQKIDKKDIKVPPQG